MMQEQIADKELDYVLTMFRLQLEEQLGAGFGDFMCEIKIREGKIAFIKFNREYTMKFNS